jgi:hypothetical protein
MSVRIASETRVAAGIRALSKGVRRGSRRAIKGGVNTCKLVAHQLGKHPRRTIPLVVTVVLLLAIGLPVTLSLRQRHTSVRRAAIEVSTEPLAEKTRAIGSGRIAEARKLLAEGDITAAETIADSLIAADSTSPHGFILRGQTAIRSRDYEEAAGWFERAGDLKGGRRALRKDLPLILVDIGHMLTQRRAPSSLIDVAVNTLEAADTDIVSTWTTDKRYWLRWGAVHLREAAGLPYDTVQVTILDLKHAGSARTRRAAARRLGELGDPRAIPALEEARDNGLADPFVSPTAATVLQESFADR